MTNIHGGHFIAGAWQRGDSGFTPEYPGGDGGRVDHFFNANEDTVAAAVAAAAAALYPVLRPSEEVEESTEVAPIAAPVSLGALVEPLPEPTLRGLVADTVEVVFRVTQSGVAVADTTVLLTSSADDLELLQETLSTDSLGLARGSVVLPDRPCRLRIRLGWGAGSRGGEDVVLSAHLRSTDGTWQAQLLDGERIGRSPDSQPVEVLWLGVPHAPVRVAFLELQLRTGAGQPVYIQGAEVVSR